jgi:MYXO-CTERM domain-containing protein
MMRVFVLLLAVCLIALVPGAVSAQEMDPESVVRAWHAAVHSGDIDAAMDHLADDIVVNLVPPPPGTDGNFEGKAEVRAWYEQQAAASSASEILSIEVDGNHVTAQETYADDSLRGMGVDQVELVVEFVVEGGLIQSYTASFTEESLAKLPPMPEEMPTTGAGPSAGLWLLLAGLGLIALGARRRVVGAD